jgi:hypothetical protein
VRKPSCKSSENNWLFFRRNPTGPERSSARRLPPLASTRVPPATRRRGRVTDSRSVAKAWSFSSGKRPRYHTASRKSKR